VTAVPAPGGEERAVLTARNAELSALNRVAEAAVAAPDLDLFLARAGEEVAALLGAAVVGFFLLERERREALLLHLHGGDDEDRRRLGRTPLAGDLFAAVGLDGEARIRQVPDLPPPAQALLAPLHLAAVASAPARFRSTVIGVLWVGWRERREPHACRADLLQAFGAHFAAAVETHRLLLDLRTRAAELTDTRRRVADLEAVNALALRVFATAPGDARQLLDEASREIARALAVRAVLVLQLDPGERRLTGVAGYGTPREPADIAIPLAQSDLVRRTLASGGPTWGLHVIDAPAPGEVAPPPLSVLLVPLSARGATRGVVALADRPERRFSEAETALALALAGEAAVGLENAELYAEARRRVEELSLVNEVGRSLVATLELNQVLEAGVRNLARIVDAPDGYLLLADERRERMVVRAASGGGAYLVGHSISLKLQRSLSRLVYEQRKPIAVEDVVQDPRVDPELHALTGARAYLGLPLVVREHAIGVALIAETRSTRRFTPAEVERGAAIANQLAVAVENAGLYEDLRRSYADLARAQDQLVRQERLAALGELAAVVAHEVRNPLGVVFNSLGSLRRLVPQQGDARMLLDIVGEEAERLNRMVGDLLDFARPSRPTVRPEPLDVVIEDALVAALSDGGRGVRVERDLQPDLPRVPMDARLLRQAILNLILNATQAMGGRGTLTVRAYAERGHAVLEIGDTGPGIPEDVRHRIFEPFFTTKATGRGLGLAVVKRIVDAHYGRVETRPGPQGGTVFAVRLPLRVASPLKPGISSAEDEP